MGNLNAEGNSQRCASRFLMYAVFVFQRCLQSLFDIGVVVRWVKSLFELVRGIAIRVLVFLLGTLFLFGTKDDNMWCIFVFVAVLFDIYTEKNLVRKKKGACSCSCTL